MRKFVGTLLAAGALAAGAAVASPTCSTTMNLGPTGAGVIAKTSFTSGFCVKAKNAVYGNFNLSALPKDTVVIFNLNTVNSKGYYQIAFSGTYNNKNGKGRNYDWSYEMAVATSAPALTKMVELDTDFSQTSGKSRLKEDLTQGGLAAINELKNGVVATGTTQYVFSPAITDLLVTLHLVDKGTISSVTNTVVLNSPGNNAPEPLTLSLFGAGLAGLSVLRRKRRS